MGTVFGPAQQPDFPVESGDLEFTGEWHFYATVGTTVQGRHTLARFGPRPTALDALRLAIHAVNHTAFSLLEQGVHGDPCADIRLLERLPITEFTIERHHRTTRVVDRRWALTGRKHHRKSSRRDRPAVA